MERLPELSISGMGKVNGGKFGTVDISGMGSIVGDVEAEKIAISGKGTIEGNTKASRRIDISGMGSVTGDLEAGQVNSSGTATVSGNLVADMVEISGNLKIKGTAKVKELATDGRCRIDGQLKAEKIQTRGYLSVGADVEAEDFISQGSFSMDGLLNSNIIDIEIYGFCKAKEIGGDQIYVKNRHVNLPFISRIVSSFLGNGRELDKLTVELIEGTEVSLEYTHAKTVRGNNVKIGPECVIEEVEYKESIETDPLSSVQRVTKI